jgi:hypothetical protein
VAPEVEAAFLDVFSPRWNATEVNGEPVALRVAWALVNLSILARSQGLSGELISAEEWFSSGEAPCIASLIDVRTRERAEHSLSEVELDDDFFDLYPYILDPHGPGSRASVLKDPSTSRTRAAKREIGAFYTPADVAYYISSELAQTLPATARFLDPACGTGVFLLALLREHNGGLKYIADSLYGID